MLTLPIKKKWFDMIVSGEKKEEYREIKPYYDSRFMMRSVFSWLEVRWYMEMQHRKKSGSRGRYR